MGDIESTYEIREPEDKPPPRPKASAAGVALTAVGIAAALCLALAALAIAAHAGKVSTSQAAQIRALDQSNTRLAGELAADSSQLAGMSARLAAADPASDSALITCADLRRMNLLATTGGSVSAVPGPVSLSQSAVALPAHCR
jgi:hypothetical protein